MTFILLVLKEWKVSLIVLLSTLLLISIICISQLQNTKDKVQNDFDNYITTVEKQNLINQNKQKQKELEILEKQKEVEVNYAKQVKKLQSDLTNANTTNNSLLNTLSTIKSRVPTATDSEVRAYSETATELLGKCETGKLFYAQRADEHAYAEERAVSLYNALVDGEDVAEKPDTNNKE